MLTKVKKQIVTLDDAKFQTIAGIGGLAARREAIKERLHVLYLRIGNPKYCCLKNEKFINKLEAELVTNWKKIENMRVTLGKLERLAIS